MNKNSLLGFAFLAVLGFLLWIIVPPIWGAYSSLNIQLATTLTALAGGLLVAIYNKMMDRNNETKARQREKQTELYQRFLRAWTPPTDSALDDASTSFHEVELTRDMMLWASDDVLRHYSAYRRLTMNSESGVSEPIPQELTNTVLAIRKDLEHKNRKLQSEDIHTLFGKEAETWDLGSLDAIKQELPSSATPDLRLQPSAEAHKKTA